MKKASEYRQHAADCRELAAKMDIDENREQLLAMAAIWDQLAQERAALIQRHPDLAAPGEEQEEEQEAAQRHAHG